MATTSIFPANHFGTITQFSNNLHHLVTIKLDHTNFIVWQKQITLPLRAFRLMRFVDGSFTPPPQTILTADSPIPQPNPDFDTWNETDALILSSILSTFSTSLLPTLNHHLTSSSLWLDLIDTFTATSISRIHDLKTQLTKTHKDTTMAAYITKLREISDQLALVGAPLTDFDLVHQTLINLPIDYKPLKTFVRNTIPPITFNRLCLMLTDEEIHVNNEENNTTSPNPTAALTAQTFSQNPPSQPHFHQHLRTGQPSRGHFRGRSSRGRGFSTATRGPRPVNPNGETCQICGRNNHLASTCYHRNNPSFQRQALYVGHPLPPNEQPQSWFFDSGATNHLTHNSENLSMSQPYMGGDQVAVGNGAHLPIHHSGDGLLPTPMIQGISVESVNRASDKIQAIIDEAVKSPYLDYSHFVSLPLAVNPELVNKLINFQNSILGLSGSVSNPTFESDSNKNTSYDEDKDPLKALDVSLELKDDDGKNPTEMDIKNIPITSYLPKESVSPTLSDLGIEKSIFITPNTFHLTVLMLKLWNKDRVEAATEILKSVLPKVIDALDSRPISVRLRGLSCMKGSLAKARVLYAPVEEVGDENRLLRACQVIIDAYVKAGLVLDRDATHSLKLHATVMNARHRKRNKKGRTLDFFDARGIMKQYGSEEWGEYLIQEAHLSQRFAFDERGYYHCCASIPFPENMQVN